MASRSPLILCLALLAGTARAQTPAPAPGENPSPTAGAGAGVGAESAPPAVSTPIPTPTPPTPALETPAASVAGGQSLFAPVPLAPTPLPAGALMASEDSVRRALASGLTATAAAQAEQLLVRAQSEGAARDTAALLLATARLELGDMLGARAALTNHGPMRTPSYHVRAGLIAARLGQAAVAQAELSALRPEALPTEERAWFYFLQGLLAEGARDTGRAASAYDQALNAAVSDWQRARLRLTRERLRLTQGEATENQANELRALAERYAGRGVGTDYAVQHAVALTLLGRREAATAYLQEHLRLVDAAGAPTARDDTRLMLGLVAGPNRGAGRGALEQLLGNGADASKQRMALALLAEGAESPEAREQLRRTATRLLASEPPHPLTEEFLLTRAELALVDRLYPEAEAGARELLGRFPGSALRARALAQLAATAWELRRFRTAADYAAQAAAATGDGAAGAGLRLLSAEAWYRAEDYAAAADAYDAAASAPPAGVAPSAILFQRVMCEVSAGRLDEAARRLDAFAADARFDDTARWQAEWNLARRLQAAGRNAAALERVARLRAEPTAAARPPGLRARMLWLEARLAQDSGRPETALAAARALPESLAGVEEGLAREIAGLGRLLEAEALFGLGRGDEALATLASLRAAEAGTEAALQSFLVEAEYRSMVGGLVEAQGLLTSFADKYPEHEYAPYAIFQAALNAERRGEDAYYREAFVLLERVVKHPKAAALVFPARMKQGDLLRRLGEFAAAQNIYEDLVNRQAQHPDILSAQMALADCHRAQAAQDASHFESAATLLERLRDIASAPVDLRAEAGFKLGDLLAQRDSRSALAVWGPLLDALAIDPESTSRLGARGRYWVGRMLVRMAALLEQSGQTDEAKDVYRLVVDRGLPGLNIAAARLVPGADTPR